MLGFDAATGVLYFDDHSASPSGVIRPRPHLDYAASWTCLYGIEKHVEKYLINFAGVTQDRRQWGEVRPHLDGFILDFVADDFQRRLQGGVEVGLLEFGLI